MKSYQLLICAAAVLFTTVPLRAQTVLTLEECRAMALENHGQSKIAREKVNAAEYDSKAAFANYLPKVSATAMYLHNSDNINLISQEKQERLAAVGTTGVGLTGSLISDPDFMTLYLNDPSLRNVANYIVGKMSDEDIEGQLNRIGQDLADDLTLDIQNIYVGLVSVQEPIYAGGKIRAYNRVTAYAKELAEGPGSLSRSEKQDRNNMWESVFTVVSNCNERKLNIRFFEDEERKLTLSI